MATYPIRNRRWTRQEYDELIKIGFFVEDEPIELLGGQLVVAEPKGSPHSTAIALAADTLRAAFGSRWLIRVQDPIALDAESEPEPDVVVVPGLPRDYLAEHPTRPALLLEVAESSLAFDRGHKGRLYARAGVADYWIVNLERGTRGLPPACAGSIGGVRLALPRRPGSPLRHHHRTTRTARCHCGSRPPAAVTRDEATPSADRGLVEHHRITGRPRRADDPDRRPDERAFHDLVAHE